MEQEITYKVSAKDLKETLVDIIRREVRAEYKAEFNQRVVSSAAVAMIHGVNVKTVHEYVKSGDVICEPHLEGQDYKFRLGNILEVDFKMLRKQLKLQKPRR